MLDYVFALGRLFVENVTTFDSQGWLWVSIVVVVLGFMCMRGFGSRTNY